eukprot:gene12426-16669_t
MIRNNFILRRLLSTPAKKVPPTALQIKESEERAAKFREFLKVPVARLPFKGRIDESEPLANPADLAALNGMPEEHAKRTVVISQKMFKSVQSGDKFSHQWQIKWKNMERWTNPLMGWTSSADPLGNLRLSFDTQEQAELFARKNGWKFEVESPTVTNVIPSGDNLYRYNFLPKRTTLELKKSGVKTTLFVNPKYGQSNFFMPLTYHGDKEVEQFGPVATKNSK